MTNITTYFGLLLTRASQKSFDLTDRLTVLIVPFSTLVLWLAGTKMTNTIQATLALGVAMTVIAVVALRLIASSYLVWKDDQTEKRDLRKSLDAPEREIEASLKIYTTERRKILSEKLGRLSAIANYKTEFLPNFGIDSQSIHNLLMDIDSLINQLSYDVPVRIASIRLKDYCVSLISGESTDRKRLWEQRKLTFRLLHRQDRISDFMTMVDIHILTDGDEKEGGSKKRPDIFENLKASIKQLGQNYYDREVTDSLRKAARYDKEESNF